MYARRGLGTADPVTAGIAAATAGVNTWLNQINLAHQADTATTQIVNGLAPLLQANLDAYKASPGSCADQAAAMAAYLTAVKWLFSPAGCGNGAYGAAGNRCITDRFGGGGPTDPNAKFPWAAYYYLPIANDTRAAGCAANLPPDAALQAAVANINAAVSGSSQQTTAGQFTGGGVATDLAAAVSGIPTWAWLAGGGLLLWVVLK